MPSKPSARKSTTEKGLGWQHQRVVAKLLRKHIDGTLCWWCGLPMSRDTRTNWDRKTLAGDHSIPRAHMPNGHADRLLHGICNSQRGDGRWDHRRPVLHDQHPSQWTTTGAAPTAPTMDTTDLAMEW